MYPRNLEIRILNLQMHFVLTWSANAYTGFIALQYLKKNFINKRQQFFSTPLAAQTLVTPLI